MLTEKDYCDYETSCALAELGFNGFTQGAYKYKDKLVFQPAWLDTRRAKFLGLIIAPHLYSAQKWLREEKEMLLQPTYLELSDEWICVIRDKNKRHGYSSQKQKDYEEALLEGVKCAVKILKDGIDD